MRLKDCKQGMEDERRGGVIGWMDEEMTDRAMSSAGWLPFNRLKGGKEKQ